MLGYGSLGGNNCITNAPGYNVTNLSDPYIPIYGRHDYWGSVCCKKFFGYVECDSCVTASACEDAALVQNMPLSDPDVNDRLPRSLDLVGAAPNPFNPTVRIRFAVPAPGARVRISVYNVRGQRVADLEDGLFIAGYHETTWYGTESRGAPVASGIYFVQMRSGGFRKAMKIVLVK
ncbi:MAG: T9SS type A sorting domain-containing protein [Candidatus Latescibacteria bacterium]|nr:T9SS type A sorting domain-containing protein [Candidatus Latescibacterota bacterium]